MSSDLTIRAKLNDEVIDGIGVPVSVTVTGAGFLAPSALADIAQEVLDARSGDYSRDYLAMMPDSELVSDNMRIKVIKRRVR